MNNKLFIEISLYFYSLYYAVEIIDSSNSDFDGMKVFFNRHKELESIDNDCAASYTQFKQHRNTINKDLKSICDSYGVEYTLFLFRAKNNKMEAVIRINNN